MFTLTTATFTEAGPSALPAAVLSCTTSTTSKDTGLPSPSVTCSPAPTSTDELPAAADPVGLLADKRKETVALAAIFGSMYVMGWNDASTGPLLPRMREHYNVGFTVVSMLFVSNFIGFILAAVSNIWASDRFGFGKVIAFGAALQIVAYALQAWAPPFPLLCVSFTLAGAACGFQNAQANTFVSLLPNASPKLGFTHALYGVGAFCAPLVATQFSQKDKWSFYYLVSLALAVLNTASLIYVFRGRSGDKLLGEGISTHEISATPVSGHASGAKLRDILCRSLVHVFATFILVYVACEVTVSGWIVTFMLEHRDGGPSSGYVSSGFWAGLTIGRVALLPLNSWVGEQRVIYLYCIIGIALELIVWFVPNLIGGAVAVAFLGLVLAPFYPIVMSSCTKLLPRRLCGAAVGWIGSTGQAGSAAGPFLTGALASNFGVKVLQPIIIGMLVVDMILWWFVPTIPRRLE